MEMCPEEMERWGAASIFKDSARLLHKHYRLYLPFFFAFYLPISIAGVLQTTFLSPSSPPLPDAIVAKGSINTAQTTDPPGGSPITTILSLTLYFLIYVVGILGTGAVSYITAYLYNPTPTDDDRSMVPKVFKLLPHAFLRIFITQLWMTLASVMIAVIPLALMSAAAGWSDPKFLFAAFFLFLAGKIFLAVVFALAQVIAVLEPGNYGKKALIRSTELAMIGRVWTIVAVTLTASVLSVGFTVSTYLITTGGMPVWVKIVLGVAIGGLDSVFSVYFGVVSVVMYFVYEARFDAAGSEVIPVFRRIYSAEHSNADSGGEEFV